MRHIIFTLLLCLPLMLPAQKTKLGVKENIESFEIELDKMEMCDDGVCISGKIKQKENFSYTVSFDDCRLIPAGGNPVAGKLAIWNGNKKVGNAVKPISDNEPEHFVLAFPAFDIDAVPEMDLIIGTVLNRRKTPLSLKISH